MAKPFPKLMTDLGPTSGKLKECKAKYISESIVYIYRDRDRGDIAARHIIFKQQKIMTKES